MRERSDEDETAGERGKMGEFRGKTNRLVDILNAGTVVSAARSSTVNENPPGAPRVPEQSLCLIKLAISWNSFCLLGGF